MMNKWLFRLLYCLLFTLFACAKEPVKTETPLPVVSGIVNAGFDDDGKEVRTPTGWSLSGDTEAVSVVMSGGKGNFVLYYNLDAAYRVTATQTVNDLEDGVYNLEFYYQNSGGQNCCYVSAGSSPGTEKMTSLQTTPDVWGMSVVRGVEVSGGKCVVSIISDANGGMWTKIDNLTLKKSDKAYHLLKGGDLSQLSYIEHMGGKFYDNGKEKDCFAILRDKGFNIVRLRLYNDPGNPAYSPSNRLPSGFQGPSDILQLSKRASNAGMQIMLTIHYSDYWTNGKTQHKPHAWENMSFTELKEAVYNYTYDYLSTMKKEGVTPAFVALGNETVNGFLYPDGAYSNSPVQMSELFKQGYLAVKAVSPETIVLVHLDDAGNRDKYDWFLSELGRHGVPYDMIGASYYPFWTRKTAAEMREWADYVSQKYDRDIFIMETGYTWNSTLPEGYPGQLSDNGPYQNVYPSSPRGQKEFLLELFSEIKKSRNGRVTGLLYWDPVMIEVPGVGWELGANNVVSNTTLFDFSGNALDALSVFTYNN